MQKAICSTERRRAAARLVMSGLLGIVLGGLCRPAFADTAAGRAAYEKGDYARAVSEWQRAAEGGDVAAEVSLGRLFEAGAGDLRQNYKLADYWYRKAAAKGDAEAEYRLALIWSAGTREFLPDLAQADRWASLAAAAKDPRASLAAALQAQIERALKQRPTASPAAPAPDSPPPPKPALASLASAPPPRAPAPPPALEQLNKELAQIECAALQTRLQTGGGVIIAGTVPDAEQKTKLVRLADRPVADSRPRVEVEVVPPPICNWLSEFEALRRAGVFADTALAVRLADGTDRLHEGEPIKVSVASPGYRAELRIDYFSLDGNVLHLWPTAADPSARLDASGARVFWDAGGGKTWDAGGAPFGTEAITAIATAAPLALGARAPVEPAADYLRDLKAALLRIPVGTATPNSVATLLVKTGPR